MLDEGHIAVPSVAAEMVSLLIVAGLTIAVLVSLNAIVGWLCA